MPLKTLTVLGIDPGYDRCGVGVVRKDEHGKEIVLFSSCIQTDSKSSFESRLASIANELEQIISNYKPDIIALESLFFNTNNTTAMNVAGVRGVIAYIAHRHNTPLKEFTPLQTKLSITGYGRSTKNQIISMVERLVVLEKKKRLDDEYDALAVALTCIACEKVFHSSL
jgi:crossover junction endodeoxyribonuclease RuvC